MLDKLAAIHDRYLEVEKLISSSDAMNDMKLFIQLSKEYKDLEPIISELIIDKMQNNFICDIKCKGLCAYCGNNLTKKACNCEEKNLKESPFSSLSQLDL